MPLQPCKHDFFISYRTQEAKDAVSSFSGAVRHWQGGELGLSTGEGGEAEEQGWAQKRAGARAEAPSQADSMRQLEPGSCHCQRQTIWCTSAEINMLKHFFPCLISCVWSDSFLHWEESLFYSFITPRRRGCKVVMKLNYSIQQASPSLRHGGFCCSLELW